MFDDPFCQFPIFSRDFSDNLSKLLSSSDEDRFQGKKSSEKKCSFSEFRI